MYNVYVTVNDENDDIYVKAQPMSKMILYNTNLRNWPAIYENVDT